MPNAASYGLPRIRVRKLAEVGHWIFRKTTYEVEFTELGATQPAWIKETTDPAGLIRPYLGLADAHSVVDAANRTSTWASLFDTDD